ncbi:hypothetical protein [Prauserella muralis]|uniref:Uncharacterized protein n=1 Tax=Prauserella muralis TaxID=588067 RepID=A0A2V4ADF2_9PSEU|nr:hypothetical protein [Prauserella muralis]PXY16540.1 hypothetical protein BAY60_35655 [Prauserella muralis]TWE11221.1 hypothetical protein FHX69_7443 [Prauserella muralis]
MPTTTPPSDNDVETELADALSQLWKAITRRHRDVSPAPPWPARRRDTPGGWLRGGLTARYPRRTELADGAHASLAALLHEATHRIAEARGIAVTSSRGVYHNTRFRDLAREVGLEAHQDDPAKPGGGPRGWARDTLPPATVQRYREHLTRLDAALRRYPAPPPTAERNYVAARCQCRSLRMAPTELARGPVLCGLCHSPFLPTD